ncbi:hypothetical protein F7725_008730 [Dissostichus mawsoni]|uniref:C2H2-type domain-containing protein n=1 Tax=Dissostichus mawsoni TaxID=36200 RepID=A0A7J5YAI2_DISMA|nr:hypothetical protein F7725_008730 [Dissostichus mawsoni]
MLLRGEKPFSCSLCSRSFSDSSAKRRHEASHSGRKPFSCSSCSLSFTRLDNLKTHSRGHSKERAEPPTEDPPEDPQLHEEQIQLVVTDDLSFVSGQNQEISIITTEEAESGGGASTDSAPRLTLLTHGGGASADSAPSRLEGVHVITLSKEALDQLSSCHHGPPLHHGPPSIMDPPYIMDPLTSWTPPPLTAYQ